MLIDLYIKLFSFIYIDFTSYVSLFILFFLSICTSVEQRVTTSGGRGLRLVDGAGAVRVHHVEHRVQILVVFPCILISYNIVLYLIRYRIDADT